MYQYILSIHLIINTPYQHTSNTPYRPACDVPTLITFTLPQT